MIIISLVYVRHIANVQIAPPPIIFVQFEQNICPYNPPECRSGATPSSAFISRGNAYRNGVPTPFLPWEHPFHTVLQSSGGYLEEDGKEKQEGVKMADIGREGESEGKGRDQR